MSSYSTQTVAQLKELLKAKGLPTGGVKSDLIARLEEADKTNGNGADPEEELLDIEEEPVEAAPVVSESTETKSEETTESKKSTETKEEIKEEDKPKTIKQLTPEERKAAAIELINKRILRAKKFGSEEDVASAQKDLARVEKFGVELGTALAREIGLASSGGLREHRSKHKHKGFKKRFKRN